jgi:mannose-1-phosphate guanylyltransferase/mannose-1-phosphate guanylyltransferase/phosphomannomutase
MILAAGFGARLRPYSLQVPKPLFPLFNKPLLERSVELLAGVPGLSRIIINSHHLPGLISAEVKRLQGKFPALELINSHEKGAILGTAGGIKKVEKYWKGSTLILVNGDITIDINLAGMAAAHQRKGGIATLAVIPGKPVKKEIGISERGEVTHFPYVPSPKAKPYLWGRFTCVHMIEEDLLKFIPPRTFYGINDHAYPKALAAGHKLFGFLHHGYWSDIGTVEAYLQTHAELLASRPNYVLPTGTRKDLFIGRNCEIAISAKFSGFNVLGDSAKVEDKVILENCVVWNGVSVKTGSTHKNTIIAK